MVVANTATNKTENPVTKFPLEERNIGFLVGNIITESISNGKNCRVLRLINFYNYDIDVLQTDITLIDDLISDTDLYLESLNSLVLYESNKVNPVIIFGFTCDLKEIVCIEGLDFHLFVPTGNHDQFGVAEQLLYSFKSGELEGLLATIEEWAEVLPISEMSLIIGKTIDPILKVPEEASVYDEVISLIED